MKNPKKPSVSEHKHISTYRLNSRNWLISKKTSENWLLVHKETGTQRTIIAP